MSAARTFVVVAVLVSVLGLGVLLRHEALGASFWADDYLQIAMLEGHYPRPRAAWDLFRFCDGSPADTQALMGAGYYPWWTHQGFQLSMLRPLPSLLHAADHALFVGNARAQHAHSVVWWALCVLAAYAFLSSLLPRGTALLAATFFALDESATVPIVWLSNRSVLVATTFAFAGLALHVRSRRGPAATKTATRGGSIALLALAVASGEYAIAALSYLVAFELLEGGETRARVRAAAPGLALGAALLVISPLLGYGSAHSGLYASPLRAPLDYLGKLAVGIPVLSGDLVLGLPADYYSLGAPLHVANWQALQLWIGLGAIGIMGALLAWLRRRLAPGEWRATAALALGAALALFPVSSSFITTRLVLPAALGASAVFAVAVHAGLAELRTGSSWRRALALPICAALVLLHGLHAASAASTSTSLYAYMALSRTAWPLSAQLDDARVAKQTVVLIASADVNDAAYLPYVRAAFGKPMPESSFVLSAALSSHALRRIDDHTLELGVLQPAAVAGTTAGSLTRARDEPLRTGDEIRLDGMTVRVVAARNGNPIQTRFRFDDALDSPSLVFLVSAPAGLVHLALPPLGQTVIVPPPQPPDLASLTTPR